MIITKVLLCLLLASVSICNGQIKAVTEAGNEVILYNDGTWKNAEGFRNIDSSIIKTNPTAFNKGSNASFLLKAKNGNLGFWIDPKKWRFGKGTSNPDADFELTFKGESLQGVIISELTEIPIESFEQIALINGRIVAPDLKILQKEYRLVNGLKILHLQMEGTQMGMKFSYSGYYYSNSITSVQFLVVSYSNLMKKYTREVDELLDGLVEIKPVSPKNLKIQATDNPLAKDTTAQGIFSPNNNCKQFFVGNWTYMANNEKVDLERTFNRTIEHLEKGKYVMEYTNKWINDCKYQLTLKRTTKFNPLVKVGDVFTVDILEIDKNKMQYSVSFKGVELPGEMTKLN